MSRSPFVPGTKLYDHRGTFRVNPIYKRSDETYDEWVARVEAAEADDRQKNEKNSK